MSTPYLGEIRAVGFPFTPVGWAPCNGQLLSINENDALFSLLGTTYGGDGQTNFNVPNLNSRVAVGTQAGPGLSNYVLGQTGGQEQVTLSTNNLPPHNHGFSGTLAASTTGTATDDPAGHLPGNSPSAYATAPDNSALAATALTGTTSSAGGSQQHPNIQPLLALNYIICTEGIYPPQPS